MSKAKDAMLYARRNEKRFDEMTVTQQLDELRKVRQGSNKAAMRLEDAQLLLEKVKEYQDVESAKASLKGWEIAIEGTLMLIDSGQGELPIGQVMDAMVGIARAGTLPMVDQETGEVLGEMRRP